MWGANRPPYQPIPTFQLCISNVQDPQLRARLVAATQHVGATAQAFEAAASSGQLHLVPETTDVGTVTASEMKDVYTSRMVPKPSHGDRSTTRSSSYRAAAARHGCIETSGRSTTSSPRRATTVLSVTPLDLIPCCTDCNKNKKSDAPTAADEVTMHPYFDAFDDEPWLSAEVMQTQPAHFRFYVDAPGSWDATSDEACRDALQHLQLSELYASEEPMSSLVFAGASNSFPAGPVNQA